MHVKLALLLNVALATATVLLLYVVALRMMGPPRGASWPAATFAILPGPLYFTGLVMSESAVRASSSPGSWRSRCFLPERRVEAAALGVALGLAALTRGEGLLMPPSRWPCGGGTSHGGAWLRARPLLLRSPWR